MRIEFKETNEDLKNRINIHNQFGAKDIDQWMLETLKLKPGLKILDLACGAGKQCTSFDKELKGKCQIIGTDVSETLLEEARQVGKNAISQIDFQFMDFNKPFDFEENIFDLASCCFAIYYAQDIPFTLSEVHRVLKPGGRLFTTGPMPSNKQIFYEIIKEATGKAIPLMPGSSRYASEIYSSMEKRFNKVEQHIFENPLTFLAVEPYMVYTRASMSEDRKLWNSLFTTHEDFEKLMQAIQAAAEKRLLKDGKIVMTKVVGGFIATK
ncbi:MAG: class I SAM-dependent methyltransferase [Anaerolineaceae bacterium]|nr:class I SAM-dependent methyltransferase [Anaerolineaceae bacterium]